jgi:hypothetical protein
MSTVTSIIVDCALHISTVPATYVAPGPLQQIGVSATAGSTTGTLSSTAVQVPSSLTASNTNTYTVVGASIIPTGSGAEDGIAGYIPTGSDANSILIFPLGFYPTKIEFFNETAGVIYTWVYGMTAKHMIVTTLSTPTIVDTNTLIYIDADSDGGVGNSCIVSVSATIAAGADLLCFRMSS